jgi:hypothetical protein
MAQSLMVCISVVAMLLLGVVITTEIDEGELVIIRSTFAQASTTNSGNMITPMMESTSFHLRTADRLLMDGNADAALDQINLAEICHY